MAVIANEFERAASAEELEELGARLRARNWEVVIVDSAAEARAALLDRVPQGAEVHSAKSKTLEDLGVIDLFMEGETYDFLRKKLYKLDRATQGREFRKLAAAPDIEVGSVQAVTQAGQLLVASATGSQMGPYSGAAGKLMLVIGSQKLVPDLDSAFLRIREHVQPYESARLREQFGVDTKLCRVLIMEQDFTPGTTTVILVREPLGV